MKLFSMGSVASAIGVSGALALVGCSGGEVSAGGEGDYINLGRCFGVDCGAALQSKEGEVQELATCEAPTRELVETGRFALPPNLLAMEMQAASDGSLWVLAMTQPPPPDWPESFHSAPALIRYASDGELIGVTQAIEHSQGSLDVAFTVDSSGNALVAVYDVWARDADSELFEHLNLYTYGPDLELRGAMGAKRSARCSSCSRLSSSPWRKSRSGKECRCAPATRASRLRERKSKPSFGVGLCPPQ